MSYASHIHVWISVVAFLLICGCGQDYREVIDKEDLWIWDYARVPNAEEDAGNRFIEFIEFAKQDCLHVERKQTLELLERIATARTSTVEVLRITQWPTSERVFQWTVDGRGIETVEWSAMSDCIVAVVNACKVDGDPEEMRSAAEILLLIGYQVSRNGEYLATAVFRMQLWIMAVDLLIEAGEPKAPLLELRECLIAGIRSGRDWNDDRVRYPGWEKCALSSR